MRLFLIRHGETVDNVAQVYAGSRDSDLTNHGFQQAQRLARYLADTDVRFTHIFASPLQRAHKTAQAIRDAQSSPSAPSITSLPLLKEQDFGSYEGKSWRDGPHGENKSKKPGFVDVESTASMVKRVDDFLDEHVNPLWRSAAAGERHVVAVVSHGIILSVLWRRILHRLPQKSVIIHPEALPDRRPISLENITHLSNTGYLELEMNRRGALLSRSASPASGEATTASQLSSSNLAGGTEEAGAANTLRPADEAAAPIPAPDADAENITWVSSTASTMLYGWRGEILTINGKEHLKGLKRTGGGVGSSKYDKSQKTLESFFKRRKVE